LNRKPFLPNSAKVIIRDDRGALLLHADVWASESSLFNVRSGGSAIGTALLETLCFAHPGPGRQPGPRTHFERELGLLLSQLLQRNQIQRLDFPRTYGPGPFHGQHGRVRLVGVIPNQHSPNQTTATPLLIPSTVSVQKEIDHALTAGEFVNAARPTDVFVFDMELGTENEVLTVRFGRARHGREWSAIIFMGPTTHLERKCDHSTRGEQMILDLLGSLNLRKLSALTLQGPEGQIRYPFLEELHDLLHAIGPRITAVTVIFGQDADLPKWAVPDVRSIPLKFATAIPALRLL